MKGIVKFKDGKDGWELREVERAEPLENEVEIEIISAGICGSELHLYHDNHWYTPGTVIGHEWAGIISRVGAKVKGFKVGDRVVSENDKNVCGYCDFCRSGYKSLCQNREGGSRENVVGYSKNGGWAEYVCMPEHGLLKVPENTTFDEACMAEPVSVIALALCIKTPITVGETVVVQGCGTMGIICALVARACGAGKVIITGTEDDEAVRLKICRELGIEYVINIQREDLKQIVLNLTDGRGADVVVEASGSPKAIVDCLSLVRVQGKIIAIGESPTSAVEYPYNPAMFRAVSLIFNMGSSYESWKMALKLMELKKIDLKPLITHKLPLSEFKKGFDLLDSKEGLKVIFKPEM
jgi:L-iditol 2-dehydrogenase